MKERPILFSAPMVRALLDGSKTQTRRAIKPAPTSSAAECFAECGLVQIRTGSRAGHPLACPYGKPGDRLWVREAFNRTNPYGDGGVYFYRADGKFPDSIGGNAFDNNECIWKPSIHMPRAASRILLEITEVRVDRLQAISEADAIAEGVESDSDGWRDYLMPSTQCCAFAYGSYQTLWDSINGPGSWDANPWVWAISFKRVTP